MLKYLCYFCWAKATTRAVQVKGRRGGNAGELDDDRYVFLMEDSNGEVVRVVAAAGT